MAVGRSLVFCPPRDICIFAKLEDPTGTRFARGVGTPLHLYMSQMREFAKRWPRFSVGQLQLVMYREHVAYV